MRLSGIIWEDQWEILEDLDQAWLLNLKENSSTCSMTTLFKTTRGSSSSRRTMRTSTSLTAYLQTKVLPLLLNQVLEEGVLVVRARAKEKGDSSSEKSRGRRGRRDSVEETTAMFRISSLSLKSLNKPTSRTISLETRSPTQQLQIEGTKFGSRSSNRD